MFKPTVVTDRAQLPASLSWSNPLPVPAVGAQVTVLINNLGPATVRGYLQQDGFLGVWVQVHNPPAWMVQQTRGDAHGAAFGREIELSTTPPETDEEDDGPYIAPDPFDRHDEVPLDAEQDDEENDSDHRGEYGPYEDVGDGRDYYDIEYDR
ncbi:hypothetical protein [Hymenobacter jeollabukensis]|uniref:Uncharacterized protein n=1 Tax=Hymenobacter jeollabukensis TaxID=2025313 RepID=A0A5R8WIU9_9BACT|nr:hypothetical protein [Hymenobacter jeollabukensis]TLM88809.1 hypothetical protein FDY95_23530 [Hymenobacter jeollabukensis]